MSKTIAHVEKKTDLRLPSTRTNSGKQRFAGTKRPRYRTFKHEFNTNVITFYLLHKFSYLNFIDIDILSIFLGFLIFFFIQDFPEKHFVSVALLL